MPSRRCVCGCGQRAVQKHHAVYVQELRRVALERERSTLRAFYVEKPPTFRKLRDDKRNLVDVARGCHDAHHARSRPLPLWVLPDSVFEFASELLGGPAAFEYLSRRYRGGDPRLEALLS